MTESVIRLSVKAADHRNKCLFVHKWHVACENKQPWRSTTLEERLQSTHWAAVRMLVHHDFQAKKIIIPGICLTCANENFSCNRSEQSCSFADESLAIGGEKRLVTPKPATVASG